MNPTISVVLPIKDGATWLPALLASLVREWATGFELIAIDDGSRDGSGELLQALCAHWPSQRWTLLQGHGGGVSAARNQGVAASQAPLIAFIDADDRALPGRLRLPLALFKNQPELSHAQGGWWRCDAHGTMQHSVRPWDQGVGGFSWRQCMQHKVVLPSAWTIRREALMAVGGFDEELRHSEDVDLLLRLARSGHKGAWIKQELVRYRIHSRNTSSQLRPQLQGVLNVLERHLSGLPASERAWSRRQRYGTTTWAVWQAWQASDPHFALELLAQALQDCPYPLVRRPVHLIEVFARSSSIIGADFERQVLLNSTFWQKAEALLMAR